MLKSPGQWEKQGSRHKYSESKEDMEIIDVKNQKLRIQKIFHSMFSLNAAHQ